MMKHLIAIAAFAIAGWAPPAYAQAAGPTALPETEQAIAAAIEQGAPSETTGIETSIVLGVISLENFFETLEGSNLRAREVVLLPGARIAVHSHDRRPAVAYVLEGEIVEHRSDSEEPVIRRQGDTYFETFGVVHWAENISPNRARVLAVDIVPGEIE